MSSKTDNIRDVAVWPTPSIYGTALYSAMFLSFFMSCITLLLLPLPTQAVDSREKVLVVEQEMISLMDSLSAPPSVRIMTNFSWPNGLPVVDAWTPLPWFRQLHTHWLVTMTWLIVAPLQLASLGGTKLFSRKWHRWLGYVFAFCSSCIAMGLMEIIGSGRVYGQPHWLAMVINISKVSYFVMSLILAVWWYSPRRRSLSKSKMQLELQHKMWILRHVTMGYTVAFQRFLMFVVGPLLHAAVAMINLPQFDAERMLTSIEIQQWYNVTSVVAVVVPFLLMERYVIQGSFLETLGTRTNANVRKRD